MGIRVAKKIGHLNTNASIFVDNFEDRLEELDCIDDSKVMSLIRAYWGNVKDLPIYARSALNVITSLDFQQDIPIYHFIAKVIDAGDNNLGILVTDPELHKTARYGDLIDYYEHCAYCEEQENDCAMQIQYLNRPLTISSDAWLLESDLIASEEQKQALMLYRDINVELINKTKFCYGFEKKALQQELNLENSFFVPYIPLSSFIALKAVGLLKEDVTYLEFAKSFKAVIMTYWS